MIFNLGQLFEAHHVKDGRIVESNFHDFPLPRMPGTPKVETVLVPTGGFWGGHGEPGALCVVPAVLNAVFAATGKRIRSLPLRAKGTWRRRDGARGEPSMSARGRTRLLVTVGLLAMALRGAAGVGRWIGHPFRGGGRCGARPRGVRRARRRPLRALPCGARHRAPRATSGPSLAGVGARLTPAQIRLRVADITRVNPRAAMPAFHRVEGLQRVAAEYRGRPVLTGQQVEDLVAWLSTLR